MADTARDRQAGDGSNDGGTATLRVGPLDMARAAIAAGPVHLPDGSGRDRSSTILFVVDGNLRVAQLGNRIDLSPGDATLLDHAAPFEVEASDNARLLSIRVPTRLLKDHLPSPEWLCARRLPGDTGVTGPVVALIGALFDGGDIAMAAAYQLRIARHVLDLVATSYAILFDAQEAGSSILLARQAAVKLYIEQHLRDPELSPCSVSTGLRLSSRYLRLIFAATDETVSAYILRRRLEECARQIADPRWRGHSMTEIAFAWGFNSAPHFTRSFRDRFATAPRDYRRAKLDAIERRVA